MSLKDVKPGDMVFVVPQETRARPVRVGFMTEITRVGRKYAYISFYKNGSENPFDRSTGMSFHKEHIVRENGYGFDVFIDEQSYIKSEYESRQRYRLPKRLVDSWYVLKKCIPQEAVEEIHQVLDKYGVK